MAAAFNLTAQINLQGPANLKATVSKIKKEFGSIKTTLNLDVKPGTAKNLGQITRSLNTLSKAATNANASISNLNSTLSSLASSFNNASSSTSAALNGFNSVSKSAKGSTKAIQETRSAIEEFGKQSGLAIKRFAAFSTVSTIIYGVVNAINTGFKEFVTFNQEIVRLSQVTNKSIGDLKGVTDEITRLSTGLGVASSDLLTVTTTLAQAGFTAEETKIALEALAKSALAPSFENLASTTEGAIAAMRQFGIQAGELDDALGSINAVAAAFAVEAGDIIAAIQRTGGVFAASSKGVSEGTDALNEFIAVFTSIRATTRESAETIATGLRTIFTRIQRSSTIQLLKDYGVELRDLEGKFVGPYEAVRRLSEGLSKIDPRSAAFAAISEELGGFRQIGKVIPLLQQFSVAQDALNVAQKGQKSLAKDAVSAQQSLAVQFTKTRESFLALIRDIGETGTFKAFVGTTLTLTNALITLGGALKPILPLLLTFTAIKLGSALKEYSSGFFGAFRGGGGAAGGGGIPGGGGGGGTGGGGAAGKAAALISNTTALTTLNTSILALNQNIVNTNSLLLNKPASGKFANGGLVPGSGNSDTYRAMLTPGEFVIRKKAVEKIGVQNLAAMNSGGEVQKFADAGKVKLTGRGKKGRRGARSSFRELDETELAQLSTSDLIKYAKAQARDIFSSGGAGMAIGSEFIEVSPNKIIPELEQDLITYMGKRGFWREKIAPFGRSVQKTENISQKASREQALKMQMSRQADEIAARDQNWTAIQSGSAIDNYLLSSLQDPILSDYKTVRSGGSLAKTFHNTRLRQSVNKALDSYDDFDYSPQNVDKLVKSFAAKQFNNGGFVQKFVDGGEVELLKNMVGPDGKYRFGIAALRSGTTNQQRRTENFKLNFNTKKQKSDRKPIDVEAHIGTLSGATTKNASQNIEKTITKSIRSTIVQSAKNIGSLLGVKSISGSAKQDVLKGTTLSSAVGSVFEGALGLLGAPYIDKTEKIKSMDFPFGMGSALSEKFFGSTGFEKMPTDATRTFGGAGKNLSDFKGQIRRFINAVDNKEFTKALEKKEQKLATKQLKSSEEGKLLSRIQKIWTGTGTGKKVEDALSSNAIYKQVKAMGAPRAFASRSGTFLSQMKKFATKGTLPESDRLSLLQTVEAALNAKASGGGSSSQDSVHALLTPGEFVFNKKAAQRIGYNNLNRLNQADKLPGFNRGGAVGTAGNPRRYLNGSPGGVQETGGIDKAAVVAAITSILLPEVQKLAASFGKLEGASAEAGAAIGGFVREASSMVLSAGIAMQTVGASRRATALTQGVGGILAGTSGALTDYSAKAMERALVKNTESIGKFNKNLEDYNNAQTEELKLEASKRLEQSFFELDRSVRNSIPSIDKLEKLNLAGEALGSFTQTTLSVVTALVALRTAVLAQEAITLASGGKQAGGAIGGIIAAGAKNPYVALVAGLVTVGAGIYQASLTYNRSLKKSSEQLDKLNSALEETTKSSRDFSIANQRYSQQVLPQLDLEQFRKSTPFEQNRTIRELGKFDIGNEMNLLFRQAFKSQLLSGAGIELPGNIGMKEARQNLVNRGLSASVAAFDEAEKETKRVLARDLFRKAKKEEGLDTASIDELLASFEDGSETITRVAEEYAGRFSKNKMAADQLALANNNLKISLVSLNNVLGLTEKGFKQVLNNLTNQFDNLDKSINIMTGKEPAAISGRSYQRDIQTLENLSMARPEALQDIFARSRKLLGVDVGTPEQVTENNKLFDQLTNQIQSLAVMERSIGFALTGLAKNPSKTGDDVRKVVETVIGSSIRTALPDTEEGRATASKLMSEIEAAITRAQAEKQAPLTIEELGPIITETVEKTNKSLELLTGIFQSTAKAGDLLGEQFKKLYESQQELLNFQIQRIQSESQNRVELKRALGEYVTLGDLNKGFMDEMKTLTESIQTPIGAILGQRGTMNPEVIFSELMKARTEQLKLSATPIESMTDVETERMKTLNDKVLKLGKALSNLTDISGLLRNVFDKLAQSEGLDKNKRGMLFDLITNAGDPSKMLQFQQSVDAFGLLIKGAQGEKLNTYEASLVGQNLQFASQLLPPEMFDKLQRDFLLNFVKNNPQIGDDTSRKKILEFIEKGSSQTQAYKTLGESLMDLSKRASVLFESNLIDTTNQRFMDLASAAKSVTEQFKNLLSSTTGYGQTLTDRINTTRLAPERKTFTLTGPEAQAAIDFMQKEINQLAGDRIAMEYGYGIAPGRFGAPQNLQPVKQGVAITEQQAQLLRSMVPNVAGEVAEIAPAQIQAFYDSLLNIRQENVQANARTRWDSFDSAVESRFDALLNFSMPNATNQYTNPLQAGLMRAAAEQRKLDEQYRKDLEAYEKAGRIPEPLTPSFPPPMTPFGGRGALLNQTTPQQPQIKLNTSSFDAGVSGFNSTVEKMVKAFAPDGGVTQLATSVESLGGVANKLALVVEELKTALKDNIPNGQVKVNHSGKFDIDIPNGIDINPNNQTQTVKLNDSDKNELITMFAQRALKSIGLVQEG